MAESSLNQTLPQDGADNHKQRHRWQQKFSEDELRVFAECKRESFLYRALPLATLFGVATYTAVTNGYLKPNTRFGAAPKVILATFLGYCVGKFSYRKTCMEKMKQLPNSRFGQHLKEGGWSCGPWGGFRSYEKLTKMGADDNFKHKDVTDAASEHLTAQEKQ